MEHAQPFDRPFPWRAAALAAAAVAAMELAALLAFAGVHLFHAGTAAQARPQETRPVAATGHRSTRHVVPLRPRSRVSVLVLNGNGISGAAGTSATRLLSRGYRHAYPTDASSSYARSVVLFRRGWQGEAKRLAHDAGILTVAPLDGRLPATQSSYQLVLILGLN